MVTILITGAATIFTVVIILTIITLLIPFLMSDLYECYELADDFRQKRKDNRLQDLRKALYYLTREIQREESKQ